LVSSREGLLGLATRRFAVFGRRGTDALLHNYRDTTTLADAEDILSHGTYLLDLIDKNGEPLDLTIPLVIQPMRDATSAQDGRDDDDEAEHAPRMLPVTMSEVRLFTRGERALHPAGVPT
jgi:hypothetical protein